MQTSRFLVARVPMDTCEMWCIKGFGNVVCSCNFVICTLKYTHLCIRHGVQISGDLKTVAINIGYGFHITI
jgi:hypothetical protein